MAPTLTSTGFGKYASSVKDEEPWGILTITSSLLAASSSASRVSASVVDAMSSSEVVVVALAVITSSASVSSTSGVAARVGSARLLTLFRISDFRT